MPLLEFIFLQDDSKNDMIVRWFSEIAARGLPDTEEKKIQDVHRCQALLKCLLYYYLRRNAVYRKKNMKGQVIVSLPDATVDEQGRDDNIEVDIYQPSKFRGGDRLLNFKLNEKLKIVSLRNLDF